MSALSQDLAWASATELAIAIRERRVSAVELTDATIARIEARDPSLNAFVFRAFDEAREAAQAADAASRSLVGRTVSDVERDLILDTLDHCLGNRTHAANILGISIRTLRNKLREYSDSGLSVPSHGEQRMAG